MRRAGRATFAAPGILLLVALSGCGGADAPAQRAEPEPAGEAQEPLRTPPILQDFGIGGDFVLTSAAEGAEFDLAARRGEVFLLFFGYTRCPDFCPATLSLLTEVYERLGGRSEEVTTLFVSIDPEHDTAERLREYLGYFGVPAVGLSGTREQIDAIVGEYGGLYESVAEASEAGPLFGHSTYVYLIDRAGTVRYLFRPDDTPRFIAAGVEMALDEP